MTPNTDAMTTASVPLVGIGLPVFNGEKWIAETINSIRDQTWQNWELTIVDNASTDRTLQICRRMERQDARIRVSQNPRNLGVSANWNRVFQLSRGEYFKWSACSDLIAPEYLEACVDCLERTPDAVLCHSRTKMIDACGRRLAGYEDRFSLEDASPATRFRAFLSQSGRNNFVHGLIRRRALAETRLMEGFRQDDINLIADLALRGRFLVVDRPLFFRRETAQTDTQHMVDAEIDRYFAPDQERLARQKWKKLLSMIRIAATSPTSLPARTRILTHVARMAWWTKPDLLSELRTSFRKVHSQSH